MYFLVRYLLYGVGLGVKLVHRSQFLNLSGSTLLSSGLNRQLLND